MNANFVNLFNRMANLMMNMPKTTTALNRNANFNMQGSVFGGVATNTNISPNRSMPQVNLANANQINQNEAINQQLQESILQTQEALKEFTQEDKAVLVKSMLNLPEEMEDLLKLLSNKNENLTNAEFMKLLSMLNTNGKEAMAKLSKLMVLFGSNNLKGAEKLQEIYLILNACASGNVQNASQLMKNMILLYLPWLPIGENNNFDLTLHETKSGNGDGDENEESDSITVFIQTVNYSNVKVTLYKEQRSEVKMIIECVENFPKEELQTAIKGDAQKLSINADMTFSATNNEAPQKNDDADFSVNVSKFINPYLMLMAQSVIKAVIAIDKHTTLIEKRRAG